MMAIDAWHMNLGIFWDALMTERMWTFTVGPERIRTVSASTRTMDTRTVI
jgi:hypothetical protein